MLPGVGKSIPEVEECLLQREHRGGGLYTLCGKERGSFAGCDYRITLNALIL